MLLLLLPLAVAAPYASPEAVLQDALSTHPAVQAAQGQRDAAARMAAAAGLLPDPSLRAEVMAPLPSLDPTADMMSGVQVGIGWPLLLPGVRAARRAAAEAAVVPRVAVVDQARLDVEAAVTTAWWELATERAMAALTARHRAWVDELEAAVRARYETGRAGSADLARVDLVGARLDERLDEHAATEAALLARLAAAAALPTVEAATTPPTIVEPDGDATQWLQAARAAPALTRMLAEAAAARALGHRARADGRTMPMLMGSYTVRWPTEHTAGDDIIAVGVEVPLGLSMARMGRSEEAGQHAMARAMEAEAAGMEAMLRGELEQMSARWSRAVQAARAIDTELLPRARLAREAALTDYRVGMMPFGEVVDAERMLLDLEEQQLMLAMQTRMLQAEVRAMTGATP